MWADLDDNAEKWLVNHKKLIQFCIIVVFIVVLCIAVYTFKTRADVILRDPCKICFQTIGMPRLG